MVTRRSLTVTSLVKKSAPMVALYWLLNFLVTYWFISDVLPTLQGESEQEGREEWGREKERAVIRNNFESQVTSETLQGGS